MKIYRKDLSLRTKERIEVHDITDKINEVIKESGIAQGTVLVQVYHTTTGIVINEAEPNALEDITAHLDQQVPHDGGYKHDDPALRKDCPEDEPKNCAAHIKLACYSNSSIFWSVHKGEIDLGRYQRVLFQEFDGPCPRKHKTKRKYLVQVTGE